MHECNQLTDLLFKMRFLLYLSKKNLKALGNSKSAAIFDPTLKPTILHLMNTKKHLPLNGTKVDRAMNILRACNHRFRLDFVNMLIKRGRMSSSQLADQHSLEGRYVDEQLDVLCRFGLISAEVGEDDTYFAADEQKVERICSVVADFNEEYWPI